MSTGAVDISPSIFDRMLGFGLPRPVKPSGDEARRFYVCEKKPGAKYTMICQQGTLEEVARAATWRRQMSPNYYALYTGIHVVSVAAGCPSWNDRLVLAHKLMRPVVFGPPLGPLAPQT